MNATQPLSAHENYVIITTLYTLFTRRDGFCGVIPLPIDYIDGVTEKILQHDTPENISIDRKEVSTASIEYIVRDCAKLHYRKVTNKSTEMLLSLASTGPGHLLDLSYCEMADDGNVFIQYSSYDGDGLPSKEQAAHALRLMELCCCIVQLFEYFAKERREMLRFIPKLFLLQNPEYGEYKKPGPERGKLDEYQRKTVLDYLEAERRGITQKRFCAEKGLDESSLRRWRKIMKEKGDL